MLLYSVPLIPNLVIWWMIGALNRPVMELNLGMDSIGLFAVANKFPSILAIIFSIFISSWQISVIEEFKKPGYKEFYNKILRTLFFALTIISCIIGITSKYIVSLTVDRKFHEAWVYIPILCISFLFSSLSGIVGTNFLATRESKYFFYTSIWGAIASIVLNSMLIPIWGLWGTSLSIVLSHAVMAIIRVKFSWKYVKIQKLYIYIIMLLINIIVVISIYFLKSSIYQSLVFGLSFSVLVLLNLDILKDARANILIIAKSNK